MPLIHVLRSVHDRAPEPIIVPRRYNVTLELCAASDHHALSRFLRFAWRCTMAGAIAAAVFWVVVATVGRAAPKPAVTPRVTLFAPVLTPGNAREWMRSPLPSVQPAWIAGGQSDAAQ